MKYFNRAEAEALIPEIERILGYVLPVLESIKEKSRLISELEAAPGKHPAEIALEKAQIQFLIAGIDEWLAKIVELGAIPKGLEPALVDFPSRIGGQEIYLCWKAGEKRIAYYHGITDGFAGRKPLLSEGSSATA